MMKKLGMYSFSAEQERFARRRLTVRPHGIFVGCRHILPNGNHHSLLEGDCHPQFEGDNDGPLEGGNYKGDS